MITMKKDIPILVVDDEESVRTVLSQVLEGDGFKVTAAATGEEALKLFKRRPFDLVIIDIVLPGMSGIEVLERIKRLYPAVQVIIITSHASLETAVRALRSGAYDYLFKPFEDISLVSAVAKRAIEKISLISENRRLIAKLQGKNEELERRVAERTAELEKTNAQLMQEIKERIRAQDAAEAANRAKSEFLANMSHELRTPLNHVIGFTEIVLNKKLGELNEVQEEYLHDVLQSGEHLLSLINDILDLSKVEAGRLKLACSDTNLKILLKNSITVVKEQARKRNIRLAVDIDGIPTIIKADEGKLKQIMYNLLSNAVKFTPDGGEVRLGGRMVDCVVRRGLRREDSRDLKIVEARLDKSKGTATKTTPCVELSVSDNGIGIRPEDQERIFDRFEQVDASSDRRYQGTGLGLPLTKRLVELHGGRIWVDSGGEGKGSRFGFVIPA